MCVAVLLKIEVSSMWHVCGSTVEDEVSIMWCVCVWQRCWRLKSASCVCGSVVKD